MNRFALGVAAALAGAVLWGISGTFMQFLLHDYQVSKCFIAAFRMVVAGVLFALLLAVRKRDALRRLLKDGRSLAKIALQGFVGLFMCQLTYMLAIDYTNAGTATVLQSLNVLFVLFVACRLAHRLPRSMECVAVLCALVATSLIATKGDFGTLQIPVQGLLWGLTSALTVTFSVTFSKHLFEQWDSTVVTGVAMMAGGVFAIV